MIQPTVPDLRSLYRSLFRIRCFEETVLANFPKGVFYGTTHTYLGQEADAVGVISTLDKDDIVFSNHRCHGHYLAYGGDPYPLFAELMGRSTGLCAGRGGSQHLHWRNFYSSGVQGGILPIATGMALAEKAKGTRAITVVFLGDGTLGEGVVYEAFNMAALWRVPILFVLENNRIAQTTPIEMAVSGDMVSRFAAFRISAQELDTSDVLPIMACARQSIDAVRFEETPHALVLHTCRFGPHSKGDDTRDSLQVAELRKQRDPLRILGMRLPPGEQEIIEAEVEAEIETAYQWALRDPFPPLAWRS